MFNESVIVALVTFGSGMVISFFVAALIKGIFAGIRFLDNMRSKEVARAN